MPSRVAQANSAGISVGPAQSLWIEGKSMVIDDTYPHADPCLAFYPKAQFGYYVNWPTDVLALLLNPGKRMIQ